MTEVLRELLETRIVRGTDGTEMPLRDEMEADGGALIARAFRSAQPRRSVEIGFGFGISTLYACTAMDGAHSSWRHIVIDPAQSTHYGNLGIENIRRAGYGENVTCREEGSETALPTLFAQGMRIQAAIIDGWHTFDHALLDFFYINKMLDVGGIVVLDDANMPAIARLCRHIASYPAYAAFGEAPRSRVGTMRRIAGAVPGFGFLRRPWDTPRCAAFRKIADDARQWNWHAHF